jgi:very-short-patch-repair endonuclease
VPESTLRLLRTIYEWLGGDEDALAGKRAGSSPRPDFLLPLASLIVEVDEIQHFTTDRLRTLELYPEAALLAFDVGEYRTRISQWSSVANNYRAAKPAVDFPHPGGRRAQRAYFDAVRDLVAPSFGWTVRRVPAPECNATTATARLTTRLTELSQP